MGRKEGAYQTTRSGASTIGPEQYEGTHVLFRRQKKPRDKNEKGEVRCC